MDKKVYFSKVDFFIHLKNVSMMLTDSYIEEVYLGEMDFLVHLSKMNFALKMHPTLFAATQMLSSYF